MDEIKTMVSIPTSFYYGSGNTEQTSVTTTVQHKTATRSFDDSPWTVILVISLVTLIAVAIALLLFAPPNEGLV